MAEMVIKNTLRSVSLAMLALSLCQCSGWKETDSNRFIEVLKDRFAIELDDSAIVHVGATRFGEHSYLAKIRISEDLFEAFKGHEFISHEPLRYSAKKIQHEFDWYAYEGVATHITIIAPAIWRKSKAMLDGEVFHPANVMRIKIFLEEEIAFVEVVLEEA